MSGDVSLTFSAAGAENIVNVRQIVGFAMVTSSNGNIFRVIGPLCGKFINDANSPVTGEFPSQRPVTRRFDVFFDLHLN